MVNFKLSFHFQWRGHRVAPLFLVGDSHLLTAATPLPPHICYSTVSSIHFSRSQLYARVPFSFDSSFLFLFFVVVDDGVLFPSPMAIVLSKSQLSQIGENSGPLWIAAHSLRFSLPFFLLCVVITSCTLERPLFFPSECPTLGAELSVKKGTKKPLGPASLERGKVKWIVLPIFFSLVA